MQFPELSQYFLRKLFPNLLHQAYFPGVPHHFFSTVPVYRIGLLMLTWESLQLKFISSAYEDTSPDLLLTTYIQNIKYHAWCRAETLYLLNEWIWSPKANLEPALKQTKINKWTDEIKQINELMLESRDYQILFPLSTSSVSRLAFGLMAYFSARMSEMFPC